VGVLFFFFFTEGICHRDIAARNVLIDSRGLARISDFGRSRQVQVGAQAQTVQEIGVRAAFLCLLSNQISNYCKAVEVDVAREYVAKGIQ